MPKSKFGLELGRSHAWGTVSTRPTWVPASSRIQSAFRPRGHRELMKQILAVSPPALTKAISYIYSRGKNFFSYFLGKKHEAGHFLLGLSGENWNKAWSAWVEPRRHQSPELRRTHVEYDGTDTLRITWFPPFSLNGKASAYENPEVPLISPETQL